MFFKLWWLALLGICLGQSLPRLKPLSIEIFSNQRQAIELPVDIEKATSNSSFCRFESKELQLSKIYQRGIATKGTGTPQQQLLERLRTVSDSFAEHMLVLNGYIWILHNRKEVTTLVEADNSIHNYRIDELSEGYVPFAFNDQVIFMTEQLIIRCNLTGYHTIKKDFNETGEGLQLTANTFLLNTAITLELYRLDADRNQFKTERIFRQDDVRHMFEGAQDPWWLRCRLHNDRLYCLDNRNGLFSFGKNLRESKLERNVNNCYDFLIVNDSDMIFQCAYMGRLYQRNDLVSSKTRVSPFLVHGMFELEGWKSYYAKVSKSALTLTNILTPQYHKQEDFHQPVTQIKQRKAIGANQSVLFVMMRNRLEKYLVNMRNPRIICGSDEPVYEKIEFEVTKTDGIKALMEVHVKIRAPFVDGVPSIRWLLVWLVGLLAVAAMLFMAVICFYDRRQRYLKKIYNTIKQRNENRIPAP